MSTLTYRYRIKDATSRKRLARMASAVNDVWNYANERIAHAYRRDRRFLSQFDLINLTAGTSKDLGLHTDTLSEVCREFATRRRQCKKVRLKWRSRKRSLGWVPFKGRCVRVQGDRVTYNGMTVRFWLSRPLAGTIKAGSFTQDARGRWYVNFPCEVEDVPSHTGKAEIGIDLGLKNQLAASDCERPTSRGNITKHSARILAKVQRARKAKRAKAVHARMANSRKDWAHKQTTAIVTRASLIAVGDVSRTKLAKTRFAKSAYDAGWGTLRTRLEYKATRLGVAYCEVSERWSSVTCSACLHRTGPSGLRALGVRVWCCTHCDAVHDRDINAAHNHLRLGRQTLFRNPPNAFGGGRQMGLSPAAQGHPATTTGFPCRAGAQRNRRPL
jgi:IS605 OrfB family transposase